MLDRLNDLIAEIDLAVADQSRGNGSTSGNGFSNSSPQPSATLDLPCFGHPSMGFDSVDEFTSYLEQVESATKAAEGTLDVLRDGGSTPDAATCARAQTLLPFVRTELEAVDIMRMPQAALHLQDCRYQPSGADQSPFDARSAADAAKGWYASYNSTILSLTEWEQSCAK